ncbi:MAG: penicillin-binding protein 1A [Thiotrichales bacterium]|nr:penicillin-binding protein 1A [Thiotrichales bacterium]
MGSAKEILGNDAKRPRQTSQAPKNPRKPRAKKPNPSKKPGGRRWLKVLVWFNVLGAFFALPMVAIAFYMVTIYPTLPEVSELKQVTYQVPLRVVTQDGKLISEIGTQKRVPLDYHQIPEPMTQAVIAAEDEDFYTHSGVDFKGLARAVFELVTTGEKKSGGSTITMQVARNFYLSSEKTYLRKLNEIVLAFKIENELSKQEIMALYLNKIFLGYRSYGVAAAAQTYYGKPIDQLNLDEFAMIAGLPKAPSAFNPVRDAERAKLRRNYVLRRMNELNFITSDQMQAAMDVPVHAKLHGAEIEVEASYVAEQARLFAMEKFGETALENGLTIVTTLDSRLQQAANQAVHKGLQDYERRHGYRGPIEQLDAAFLADKTALLSKLDAINNYGDLLVGVVTDFNQTQTQVLLETDQTIQIPFVNLSWAAPYLSVNSKGKSPKKPQDVLKVGDVIYVQAQGDSWALAQEPLPESALVSLDSRDGRVLALVGGYDYFRSKFNRAIQGKRQVGSNIKPFLYSLALESGMTAATTINDAPVVFHDGNLEDYWRPENYSGQYYGPTRLRQALALSRNLVSIRLMQQVGLNAAADYFQRFGFPEQEIQTHKNLSLSLGAVEFAPMDVARAYTVFANGGFLVDPYFIAEVRDFSGAPIYQAEPKVVCPEDNCTAKTPAERVIEARNIYIMQTIMQDVIRYGSGKLASSLNRQDIAGKTGTTNDQKDAWFSGFNPNISTTVWVGFDQPSTLGRVEVGGRAALPIWMDYMRVALKNQPNQPFVMPPGLVQVPINKETGMAVPPSTKGALYEIFREEYAPQIPKVSQQQMESITEELFD